MAGPAENSEVEANNALCIRRPNSGHRLSVQCSEDGRQLARNLNVRVACQEAHCPYQIISLIEGYSFNVGPGKQHATGSSTLVKGPKNIVVDTGNPSEKDKLLRALAEKGDVTADEINVVVCTHGHSDHVGNLNLFPNAKFIVSYDVSEKDLYTVHDFQSGSPYIIDEGLVQVIPTPGHTNHDVSVIVRDTQYGVVAITGDLFEKEDDLQRDDLWLQYTEDQNLQRQSREKVLAIADFIVPGHGKMFKNTRKP